MIANWCWLLNLPTIRGAFNSQGVPVIASTASAPPTPMASIPRPPALGVWESANDQLEILDLYTISYLFRACSWKEVNR
jgi:hypothetical protein